VYRVLVEDLMTRDYLEDVCVDARIILKWIFKKWDGEAWTGFLRLRTINHTTIKILTLP
jgi:hypothetical protein